MIRNGNRIPRGATLECDVCIAGGGAAGITLAQALAGSPLRVILLESGTGQPDEATQRLAEGSVIGPGQPPLHASRLRYLGGTTNHWTGRCGPLTPTDFEARTWVPGSGWPIAYETLEPYYRRAHEICDLGPFDYGESTWGRFARPFAELAGTPLRLTLIQHSAPTRFGVKFRAALRQAANVQVLLASNLRELVPNESAKAVLSAEVATLAGNRFRVASRSTVLACGAVENARILLASNRVVGSGLGNDRDLVGRFFMDHPRARPAGVLFFTGRGASRLGQYALHEGVRATLALGLDRAFQERERITQSLVFAEGPMRAEDVAEDHATEAETARFLRRLAGVDEPAPLSEWWLRCEQSPNPESRVTLGSERDALGMPRPVLEWRLQEIDRRTLARASRVYAEAMVRAGLARTRRVPWLADEHGAGWEQVGGDWHQMGGTRMAGDPARGVVDADCRVFGIHNLFVAGASVFPTGGAIHPTLTLVALALRLADHLRRGRS